jgi:YidC/Oxa1 family membrane protein insertase
MDNQRLILIIALGFIVFLIWQTWMEEQMARNPAPDTTQSPPATAVVPDGSVATTETTGSVPTDVPDITIPDQVPTASAATTASSGDRIRVITDEFIAEIDLLGGKLTHIGLVNYPKSLQRKDEPFVLLDDGPADFFIAQAGLRFGGGSTADKVFLTPQSEYRLQDGQDSLQVPLSWSDDAGIKVIKTYTFHRGKFTIDMTQRVENNSSDTWTGIQYQQLQRTPPAESGGMLGGVYTYTGGVISTPEKNYEKIDFGDMQENNLSLQVSGGWIAMIQHYFLGAWIPDKNTTNTFYSLAPGNNRYVLGMHSPLQTIGSGESGEFHGLLYIGPKIQETLAEIADNLQRTVDYGWLWFIAEILFWALKHIYDYIGNWGWSIIVLTIIIKLIFYKLSETSYRSMANMRKLAPQMQKLKDRYGDDRQKLNQAMMEMYKKEKINPLGGCLPILVQIPVFIALYWMLLESVELRQAPWIGWIEDLSLKDPYYILPLIMGASMFIQQKLNPTPPDPIQAKVMMALPVVFTFFFLWFPSGLVLYWVVNNVLSIAQQYVITKRVEASAAKT